MSVSTINVVHATSRIYDPLEHVNHSHPSSHDMLKCWFLVSAMVEVHVARGIANRRGTQVFSPLRLRLALCLLLGLRLGLLLGLGLGFASLSGPGNRETGMLRTFDYG